MSTPSNPTNAKPGSSIGKYILLSVFVIGPTVVFTLLVARYLSLEMRAPVEKVVVADPDGDRPPLTKPESHQSGDAFDVPSLPDPFANEPRLSPDLPTGTSDQVTGTAPQWHDDQDLAMDRNARQLALRIRAAKSDEQAILRRDLELLTVRHFLHRQQRRQVQIDELSQRIEKLRSTQQQRQAGLNEIVQRRIRELLDPKIDPQWDESGTAVPVPANASTAAVGTDATVASSITAAKPAETARHTALPARGDSSLEETYDGVPYSQWLKMLETERKPEKLSVALEACSRLANKADEHRIARGIFRAAALFEQSSNETEREKVWYACAMALNRLSANVIGNEFLHDQKSYKTGRRFHGRLLVWAASLEKRGAPFESISEGVKTHAQEIIRELVRHASPKGKDSGWLLAGACSVCQLSDRSPNDFEGLPPLLVRVIDDGFAYGTWNSSIPAEWKVVAEVLIAKTPEMPDLALKLMKHWTKSHQVLDLVGKLGRLAEPVVPMIVDQFVAEWKLYEVELESETRPADHGYKCRMLIQTLGVVGIGTKGGVLLRELQLIAPSLQNQELRGAVELAISKFAKLPASDSTPMLLSDFSMIGGDWRLKTVMPPPPRVAGRVEDYELLIRRPVIELYKIDESHSVRKYMVNAIGGTHAIGDRFEITPTALPKTIALKSSDSFTFLRGGLYELTETTLRIQLAPEDQPKPVSLVKGDGPIPEGHVLLEFKRDIAAAPSATTAAIAGRAVELPMPVQPIPQAEKTYDGVPYSQWLTMLETEQKPEKLSTAINACSRLAIKGDEHKIARGIFMAAGLFETTEFPDQNHVWVQAWTALKRLPDEAVIDELLAALRDRDSYKSGREFQGRFVAERYAETLVKSPRIREVIGELIDVANRDDKGSGWLVAGACRVWQTTDLPIDAIEGFQPRVFQMIDEGLTVWRGGQSEQACFEWCMVVEAVVARIPETPDLALRLAKLAKESPAVVKFIGRLGRRAEPVVPALVEQFLAEWKVYEDELRENETSANQSRVIDIDSLSRALKRRCQLIETLGDIGAGQLGAEVVRELKLIAPPGPNYFVAGGYAPAGAAPSSAAPYSMSFVDTFFKTVHEAFPKLAQIPLDEATPMLLSDFSMINGEWRRKSPPGASPEKHRLVIQGSNQGSNQGSYLRCFGEDREYVLADFEKGIGRMLRIDPTTAIKKLTLFDVQNNRDVPGSRREGLYELTRTTLRIQLVPPGQSKPTEMAKDKDSLPEGHLLLELVRKTPEVIKPEEVPK